ncbi:MAG: cystathionine gamma-synthase family protein [Pirellulaceae bacterium]|nr:cystathionine gamma-synthase family protein [Pirellulaceae bacterium]
MNDSDKKNYRKRLIANHELHPETQMMGYGYSPHLSEGSLKPPVFLTSTFVFKNAQAGKDFFDFNSGRRQPGPGEEPGLIYSRFNNPNLEVLEDRLCLWEQAEIAGAFSSGMGAISTAMLAFLRPGDVIMFSSPIYGGTETLLEKVMVNYGIIPVPFYDGINHAALDASAEEAMARGRVGMILAETPANPTNGLVDLAYLRQISERIGERQAGHRPPLAVDNTFLGPCYQHPLHHGADLAMYSLTKYVGGHSDLVAGAIVGTKESCQPIRALRSAIGTQLDPNSAWMLLRSMETLSVRMEKANTNAKIVAEYLAQHPKIEKVNYLGFLKESDPAYAIYQRQCLAPGSTFSFYIRGGEAEAFRMLDELQVMKLAVSLGGTETLISHPASTTHSGVPKETRQRQGVTEAMIRISVGIEHPNDLIFDLEQALNAV